jgi:hypothetical protein
MRRIFAQAADQKKWFRDLLYQSSLTRTQQTQEGGFPNRLKFDSTKRTEGGSHGGRDWSSG